MTSGEMKATLWLAADKLRAQMDAAEYKHLVLGLIFLKYVSDAFEEHRRMVAEMLADPASEVYFTDDTAAQAESLEDRDYYTSANVFWVPPAARWETLRNQAKQPEIGRLLDEALIAIEDANPTLKNILDKRFARTQMEPSRLGALVDLISKIGFTSGDHAKDVLGDVYEYFLGQFATAEGKHGGRSEDVSIYGQDSNPTTWRPAAMNLAIRGYGLNLGKETTDTFAQDQHPDFKADYVLANPPFNISDRWSSKAISDGRLGRPRQAMPTMRGSSPFSGT